MSKPVKVHHFPVAGRHSAGLPMSSPRLAFICRALGAACATAFLATQVQAAQFSVLHSFDNTHGATPVGGLALDAAGNLYGTTSDGGAYAYGTLFKMTGRAFKTLHNFRGGKDGATPEGSVMVDAGGNLYGTTSAGGLPDAGTVFTVDPTGRYRKLLALDGAAQGRTIQAGLFKDADGSLYGSATYGGDPVADFGTLFRIDPATNSLATIHTFLGDDGALPMATLILSNGNLRGTGYGGTLFAVAPDGSSYARIAGNNADAIFVAGQTADADGNFWGVAMVGFAGDEGDIYRVDPTGAFSWVYSFDDANLGVGRNPTGTLVLGTDGLLYGTTRLGGAGSCRCGTVFSYDPRTGVHTTLHDFTGRDGFEPWAGLVRDAAGNLYGATKSGGKFGYGTVFSITP